MNNHKNPSGTVKIQPGTRKNQPGTLKPNMEPWKPIKTDLDPWKTNLNPWKPIKADREPWKTNLEFWKPWKLTWSCTGGLWVVTVGYRRLPGGSDHFLWQTHRHFIIIYISAAAPSSSFSWSPSQNAIFHRDGREFGSSKGSGPTLL